MPTDEHPNAPDLDRRREARYASADGELPLSELGKVIDREGLDDDPGVRVRVRIGAPLAWAEARATVIVEAPRRVACARCDGGGCDGCGRSGVIRLADDPSERTFSIELPASLGAGAIVRLTRPFGDTSEVAQVLCEIRPTNEAEGCRREGAPASALVPVGRRDLAVVPKGAPIVGIVLGAFAVVSWWLLHHC